ncbi:TlpA disulfide reductase family protein [Terrilactibacillus laevilacticus]|uniref:TlpA disulfide reductase family protein n=1 Tax=Terrilactibacillus laevilacticus TaxID=1380157 RepID=A0ABW5PQI6_9BACI|nr:TlpA disulfide reductase family protein [Terrilactibacillus laevilacticus]
MKIKKIAIRSIIFLFVMIIGFYTISESKSELNGQVVDATSIVHHSFKDAKPFSLKDRYGNTVRLSDFRGRTVLMTVWTTWCGECREELETLHHIQHHYPENKLKVLAVNLTTEETSLEDVKHFLGSEPLKATVLFDTKGIVKKRYGIYGIPISFLIDPYGKIIRTFPGVINQKDLDQWLPN